MFYRGGLIAVLCLVLVGQVSFAEESSKDENYQSLIENLSSQRQSDLKTRSVNPFEGSLVINAIEQNKGVGHELESSYVISGDQNARFLEEINIAILSVENLRCQRDLNATIDAAKRGEHWALGSK